MTLASWMPWKRVKPADPMQAVQTDPRTEDALDKVARKYKNQADLWKRAALNTEKELHKARGERDALQAKLDRMMAPLRAANAERSARAKAAAH